LWNPFQVLDIRAPAIVTWGFADGALAALRAWLEGRAAAPGHAPVPLALPAPAPQPPTRNRHATAARTTKK
jgi:beta-N-acetylhexosaminidase